MRSKSGNSLRAVSDSTLTEWDGPWPEMDAVAYLQFTSGSTGHPKGVAVTHANAMANLLVMGQMLRIKPDQPGIVWAPHYHDLCLVGHVLGPVFHGFESTLMSPLEFLKKPVRWLRAIFRREHAREIATAKNDSSPMMKAHQVTLYTRKGCHVCDDAAELLRRGGIEPRFVDIDEDSDLREQFDTCVPVVEIDGRVRFRGQVNPVLLRRLLERPA